MCKGDMVPTWTFIQNVKPLGEKEVISIVRN